MLLRIAPDMFMDLCYECVTILSIRNEIFQTAKFKSKYPWLNNLRNRVKALPSTKSNREDFKLYYEAVTILNYNGIINKRTGRAFDLSAEDRKVIAFALTYDYMISSGDNDLIDFPHQEFSARFKGAISPLEIINRWIESGVIVWDEIKQEFISEWSLNNERPQPRKAITLFEKLTGREYKGP